MNYERLKSTSRKVIIHMAWVLYIISVNTENDHLVCIASYVEFVMCYSLFRVLILLSHVLGSTRGINDQKI